MAYRSLREFLLHLVAAWALALCGLFSLVGCASYSPGAKGVALQFAVQTEDEATFKKTIEIEAHRLAILDLGTWTIEPDGNHHIVVTVPESVDAERVTSFLTEPGELSIQGENTSVTLAEAKKRGAPAGSKIYGFKRSPNFGRTEILLYTAPVITSDQFLKASAETDEMGSPALVFTLNDAGRAIFDKYSDGHILRTVAIVLDDLVLSAPVIRHRIMDGIGVITYGGTAEEMRDLAAMINAGKLPAPVSYIPDNRT
jgi:preprotein translocase subunit SecD